MKILGSLATACVMLFILIGGATQASAALTNRSADPVVLTGADVPDLAGTTPTDVVAFRWVDGWQQIPVQVDERTTVNMRDLYPFPNQTFVSNSTPVNVEVYADPLTLVGADSDTKLDANDELVAMAFDAGGEAPNDAGDVPGTIAGSGTQIKVDDPIDSNSAYIYLFESAGSLDQSAGKQYVDYDFNLTTLDPGETYLTGYNFIDGPNPENSTVTTDVYETHSSDRWIDDEITIKDGVTSPIDILDRDKALFYPGYCGRSENTFTGYTSDVAEGSYIINKSGAVRAIRSYIGANSGPYTQREHVYYQSRQDIRTFLRVHGIPMVMSFSDYSPEASGMTYRNNMNPDGVTIDGIPDPGLVEGVPADIASGGAGWEQVTGSQGTLNIVSIMETNIDTLTYSNYYLDDSTPGGGAETQCTGDAFAYGSSGFRVTSPVPNTDPKDPPSQDFKATRSIYYEKPGGTAADAERKTDQIVKPLKAEASKYPTPVVDPPPGDIVGSLTLVGSPTVKGKYLKTRIKCQIGNDACRLQRVTVIGAPKKGKGKGLLIAKSRFLSATPGQSKKLVVKLTGKARKFFRDKTVRRNGKKRTVPGPKRLRSKVIIGTKSVGFRTVKRVGRVR